jgi:hypothetical protein
MNILYISNRADVKHTIQITWVEHVEVDDTGVDPSYQDLVDSGLAFGAQRWVTTLQRQCERIASLLSNTSSISNSQSGTNCHPLCNLACN